MQDSEIDPKREQALKVWRAVRIGAGVLLIAAVVVMVGNAIAALLDEADTSRAMKMPFTLALALSILFVYSVRRIQFIESSVRKNKAPAQSAGAGFISGPV